MKRSLSLITLLAFSLSFAQEEGSQVEKKKGVSALFSVFSKMEFMFEAGASSVNKNYSMENDAPSDAIVGSFFNGYGNSSAYSIKQKNDNPYMGEFTFGGSAFLELDNGYQVIGRLFFGKTPDVELYRPIAQADLTGDAANTPNISDSEWNQPKKATLEGHFRAVPGLLVGDGRNFFGVAFSLETNKISGNDPVLAAALDGKFTERVVWLVGRVQREISVGGGKYFVAFETASNFLETLMGTEASSDMREYIVNSHKYSFDATPLNGTVIAQGSGTVTVDVGAPPVTQRITVKEVYPFHNSSSITIGRVWNKSDEDDEVDAYDWFI